MSGITYPITYRNIAEDSNLNWDQCDYFKSYVTRDGLTHQLSGVYELQSHSKYREADENCSLLWY